ncbi:MAG TPA: copper resistance CopC family protein [Stellaceae bacterium]|nr:copper resistance CopC family protein [Stellaceae bacterium]
MGSSDPSPRLSNRPIPWSALLVLGLLLIAQMVTGPATAHAILMQSMPAIDSSVTGPDLTIDLHYNSRIDLKRSRLTLMLPDKSVRVLPIKESSPPGQIDTEATGLTPGSYSLRWQVLAIDGHITRGDIPFSVMSPVTPPVTPPAAPAAKSAAAGAVVGTAP